MIIAKYNLWQLQRKCRIVAKMQSNGSGIDGVLYSQIDRAVTRIKKGGYSFMILCGGRTYRLPVPVKNAYFRPLFAMKTHTKIEEARADDSAAVDFDVPVQTPVYAVADGIVTAIEKERTGGGNDPALMGMDNFVYSYNASQNRIFCYRHLDPQPDLSLHSPVSKGMLLGHVAISGYAITPHLHFVIYTVRRNEFYMLKSIPIRFRLIK